MDNLVPEIAASELANLLMYSVERLSQIYLPMPDNVFLAAIRQDFPENARKFDGVVAYVRAEVLYPGRELLPPNGDGGGRPAIRLEETAALSRIP